MRLITQPRKEAELNKVFVDGRLYNTMEAFVAGKETNLWVCTPAGLINVPLFNCVLKKDNQEPKMFVDVTEDYDICDRSLIESWQLACK